MSRTKDKSKSLDPRTLPGHLARRVQQLAVALFVQEVGEIGLTPVQYSALQTIANQPGIDQKTLAATIGYDTSTIAGVIDRLGAEWNRTVVTVPVVRDEPVAGVAVRVALVPWARLPVNAKLPPVTTPSLLSVS